jgi:5-methylcytosine-specific restriction endonuclease McrA
MGSLKIQYIKGENFYTNMRLIKLLKFIYNAEDPHFLSIDKETYFKWRVLIKAVVKLNKNYKSCEIFRKKYKNMENFVVIGLKYSGKNVKRRASGFAKDFLNTNKSAKCIYCGVKLNNENATADHIIPISDGGNNCQVNLIVCCRECNNERGNISFQDFLNIKKKKGKRIFI